MHPLKNWILRQSPPLSQAEAARRLSVSESYLSQIITRKRSLSLERAAKWSGVTGLPMQAFLKTEDAP